MIRAPDGLFIMLHNENRVAPRFKVFQGLDEKTIIPGMEPDGGFIQDVADAGQVGAQLGGKANALCLPSRKGVPAATQGEIGKTQTVEEREPREDFRHNGTGNGFFSPCEGEGLECFQESGCGHFDQIPQVVTLDRNGKGLLIQSAAAA